MRQELFPYMGPVIVICEGQIAGFCLAAMNSLQVQPRLPTNNTTYTDINTLKHDPQLLFF